MFKIIITRFYFLIFVTFTSSFVAARETCEESKLDLRLINKAEAYIDALESGDNKQLKAIDYLNITYCGKQVFRKLYNKDYYRAEPNEDYHELQSATKTLSALAIGILMKQKPELFPFGVNTSVRSLLINKVPKHLVEKIPEHITLKHELTMTTNRSWKDFALSKQETDDFELLRNSEHGSLSFLVSLFPNEANFRQNEINRKYSQPLGTNLYNTGSSHMLSVIVHYNTAPEEYGENKRTQAFLQRHLLSHLGISDMLWETKCNVKDTRYYTCLANTDDGINAGGWNSHMRPDDFAKIGQFILNRGKVGQTQIIDSSFIDEMTEQQNPAWSFFANTTSNSHYGYQMWIEPEYGSKDLAAARGYGKQDSFVMQNENMVVTIMADISDWKAVSNTGATVKHIMRRYIAPAHQINDEGDCVRDSLKQHVINGRAVFFPNIDSKNLAANEINWLGKYHAANDDNQNTQYLGADKNIMVSLQENSLANWVLVDECR